MSSAFDRWLRDHAPDAAPDPESERQLLARVEDRLEQRRQTRNTRLTGVVCAVLAVVMIGVLDVGKLGSGNRDLIPSDEREHFHEDPLTGTFYPIRDADGSGHSLGLPVEAWEDVREQRAAGERRLIGISYWKIGDEFVWSAAYEHLVDGEWREVTDGEAVPPSRLSREAAIWLLPHVEAYETGRDLEQWRELPARRLDVKGTAYWFRVWVKETDRGPLLRAAAQLH
jgi:hypothetical protein